MSEIFSWVLRFFYYANILFGVFIIFFQKRNPGVTWAWLMLIAIVPYFGFMFYLILGFDGRKHSVFAQKAKQDKKTLIEISKVRAFVPYEEAVHRIRRFFKLPGSDHLTDLISLNYSLGNSALTTNNTVSIFYEGVSKFEALFADIKNAKRFIHMQYYIMHNDELGLKVINVLAEKAREGVEVLLLVDGMGNYRVPPKFFKILIAAGGSVALFQPPAFIRLNYRNHRKLCIIDGIIGYTGGLNIGDEYIGNSRRFGFWRDTHLRIAGDAVKDLESRFLCDWNFCSKHKIAEFKKYIPELPESDDDVPMQIVSSGPDTEWAGVHYSYVKMISEADRRVYIETPYFVPDDSILEALRIAALSGIDVRIIIPANPDHPFVYWASLSYLGELLKAGVKCYEYKNGFIHSKLIVMDGIVSSVGTANMDFRSFKLNCEINAIIYDEDVSAGLEAQFVKDLEDSEEITLDWYDKRSRIVMFKESFSRLLSPLL